MRASWAQLERHFPFDKWSWLVIKNPGENSAKNTHPHMLNILPGGIPKLRERQLFPFKNLIHIICCSLASSLVGRKIAGAAVAGVGRGRQSGLAEMSLWFLTIVIAEKYADRLRRLTTIGKNNRYYLLPPAGSFRLIINDGGRRKASPG